eukprot:1426727-Pyramimonas_sp.AAC.1
MLTTETFNAMTATKRDKLWGDDVWSALMGAFDVVSVKCNVPMHVLMNAVDGPNLTKNLRICIAFMFTKTATLSNNAQCSKWSVLRKDRRDDFVKANGHVLVQYGCSLANLSSLGGGGLDQQQSAQEAAVPAQMILSSILGLLDSDAPPILLQGGSADDDDDAEAVVKDLQKLKVLLSDSTSMLKLTQFIAVNSLSSDIMSHAARAQFVEQAG